MKSSRELFHPRSDIARCLIPLLDAIGWRGTRMQWMEALPYQPDEMGLADLLNILASLHFTSRTETTVMNRIDPRLFPCLFVPPSAPAMVILKSGASGDLLVFDGQEGGFQQRPADDTIGELIVFTPIRKGGMSPLNQQPQWFRRLMERFVGIMGWGALVSLFLSVVAMIAPLFTMTLYDQVLSGRESYSLYWFILGAVMFFLVEFAFRSLRSWLFGFISVRINHVAGTEIFRRILYLPPSYTESAPLGAQVSRIRDFETVRDFFAGPALIALLELPFTLLLFLALVAIGGNLAYIPLGGGLLLLVFSVLIHPWVARTNALAAEHTSAKRQFLVEILTNFRAIKSTGSSGYWRKRHEALSAESAVSSFQAANMTSLVNGISQTVVTLAGMATLAFGVMSVVANQLSAGGLMASMMLVWRILTPMRTGFGVITQLDKIKKSIGQLDRLMNLPMERDLEAALDISREYEGTVEFSQVSLRYTSESNPALLGVSFKVVPGRTLLLMGHDGAGKSTVLKLILGMHQPQAGRVLLDGFNVRQLDPSLLRRGVSYAPQKSALFYGTIIQNLRFADPSAAMERLEEALERAGIREEVQRLPQGIETRIGDHNIGQLSASFQRRLALARAFVRPGKVLLLDEPERGLTGEELAHLLETLKKIKGNATMIIASNHPEFGQLADEVLWLDKSRVRAWGPTGKVLPEVAGIMGWGRGV
ncbi:MAG: ATP-binding cassette domain-containing protein [Magnetococcales bacterium]|nr:ATP-binding cassette domain-containing protein [Magnetococcales bacterium]NGZ07068.1 ATP-binding cassette domain-containing protein [Magnetococcales bacterium]